MRKNINVTTLEKIRKFLGEQSEPIFVSDISKKLNLDYNSVKFAINELLDVKITKEKRGEKVKLNV